MRIAQPHAVRVALSDGRSVCGIAGADTRPRCVSACALADRRPALTVVEAAAYGCRGALLVTTPRVIAHELHWASIDGEGMRVNRVDGRRRRRRRRRRSWRLRGIAIAHVADVPRAARKQLWLNFDGILHMRESACTPDARSSRLYSENRNLQTLTETEGPPHTPTALFTPPLPRPSCSCSCSPTPHRAIAPRAQRGPKGSLLPGSIFLSSPVLLMLTVRMRPPEEPSRAIAWEMHF